MDGPVGTGEAGVSRDVRMPDPSAACTVAPVDSTEPSGSYLTPSFEHARVSDAMRPRVLTCEPSTPLMAVAQRMSSEHVHAIVVLLEVADPDREGERRPWAVVTDHDILRNAGEVGDRTAGEVATGEVLLAHPDESLPDVAQRMLEHGTSHAVVVEPRTGRPVGVLSTLDIAGILGWGLG
jgi:CBS domain-containing protein